MISSTGSEARVLSHCRWLINESGGAAIARQLHDVIFDLYLHVWYIWLNRNAFGAPDKSHIRCADAEDDGIIRCIQSCESRKSKPAA